MHVRRGQQVVGGLVGKHPSLTDLTDGDIKYHTDFRRVYATLLDDWLGVDSKGVLGDTFEKLPLIDMKKKSARRPAPDSRPQLRREPVRRRRSSRPPRRRRSRTAEA